MKTSGSHSTTITVDNLYNIKKRAIAALTEIALKEIEKYGKEISKYNLV